jgi:hypothetical protein
MAPAGWGSSPIVGQWGYVPPERGRVAARHDAAVIGVWTMARQGRHLVVSVGDVESGVDVTMRVTDPPTGDEVAMWPVRGLARRPLAWNTPQRAVVVLIEQGLTGFQVAAPTGLENAPGGDDARWSSRRLPGGMIG